MIESLRMATARASASHSVSNSESSPARSARYVLLRTSRIERSTGTSLIVNGRPALPPEVHACFGYQRDFHAARKEALK